MASHRPATCLAGLRRLAISLPSGPLGSTITAAGRAPAAAAATVQTRAKSTHLRPQDQGVLVRLLDDVPKFGRKGAIFKTERGRMRNEWFPMSKAEYLTPMRLSELGIQPDDIGEPDRAYFPLPSVVEVEAVPTPTPTPPKPTPTPLFASNPKSTPTPTPKPKPKQKAKAKPKQAKKPRPKPIQIQKPVGEQLTYAQLYTLLNKDVSETIHIKHQLEPPNRTSRLFPKRRLLQGRVTHSDVLARIRKQLSKASNGGDPGLLTRREIRFVDLPPGRKFIYTTGSFQAEIRLPDLDPVVKTVEVRPDKLSLKEYNAYGDVFEKSKVTFVKIDT
ncbi:hypothetical protein QBC39DRAFT_359733 [Podospora conica]|nr:hypothetical protein QBC39DRAFT_359733 [Schizothecium conicum]